MYTENVVRDVWRFGKACTSNVVARVAPASYVRLTGQTGRGAGEERPEQIADYFLHCLEDYRVQLASVGIDSESAIAGKHVLEYGPGDTLGTALLFVAHGAASVTCVDRFPLGADPAQAAAVFECLLQRLSAPMRERALGALRDGRSLTSGLRPDRIAYRVTPDGLSGVEAAFDLVVSRAVLEHVNSLESTLRDIERALRPGGISVHNVDLRSHNLDRYRPFDFLTWPDPLYRLMYSHKGFPNRWRPNTYRDVIADTGLSTLAMEPTGRLMLADVMRIELKVASSLRGATRDDLSWLGFWMVLRQEEQA